MRRLANWHISTLNLLILSFAYLLILSSSCTLDTDDTFYPVTEQQFLLTGDTARHLLHIQQGEINEDWLSQQGWPVEVNDMDISGEVLWFVSGQSQELFRWNGSTSEKQSFSTAPFHPHAVIAGDPFLLLIDSVSQQLGFWNIESSSIIEERPWPYKIGEGIYISGKYFVQKGNRQIEVLLENSLQPVGEINFEQDILRIQANPSRSLHVLRKDSLVYQQTFSYFSYAPVSNPVSLNDFTDVTISPYLRAAYGKEWLVNVRTKNQNLFTGNPSFRVAQNISSYAVDFFEGEVLFLRNDSLYTHTIRDASEQYLGLSMFPIQKYRALRQPLGQ